MNYTEAFAQYGAVLTNPQWSVSAFGRDGSLVVCLWEPLLKAGRVPRTLQYTDVLSNWLGNDLGRNEFRKHLNAVQVDNLNLRLAIAHPTSHGQAELIGKLSDESNIKKTFSVKKEVVGTLDEFDGDKLCIVFTRAAKPIV